MGTLTHSVEATRVKQLARAEGFGICRITTAAPLQVERARYLKWLAEGRQGSMGWMTEERAERSSDPAVSVPRAASVISVGLPYWAGHRKRSSEWAGKFARYAWGADYHAVMGERLERLALALRQEFGGEGRWYVDTGPAMDKALAARSGLGWYGKNTNILTEQYGSFVLLGEIITTLELPIDRPLAKDCGSCRLCTVACPTGALGPEYSIDANKCISYLTIEHRAAIPVELRSAIGSWVFGCDICQDVCPPTMAPYLHTTEQRRQWTDETRDLVSRTGKTGTVSGVTESDGGAPTRPAGPLFPGEIRQDMDLRRLLRLTHGEYLDLFRGTAVRRAKVWMLRRNAAVALGNVGDERCLADLRAAMLMDDHPLVRGHAAWAVGQIGRRHRVPAAWEMLSAALDAEVDDDVRSEIMAARALAA